MPHASICRLCKRALTDPVSIARGLGPGCAQHGLAEGTEHPARADYHYDVHGSVVVIYDHDIGGTSVTNDAGAVIEELSHTLNGLAGRRVIYRDSQGVFDELKVDAAGRFAGFAPIGERTLEAALATIARQPHREA